MSRRRRGADPDRTLSTLEGHRRADLAARPAGPRPRPLAGGPGPVDFTGDTVSWDPALAPPPNASPYDAAAGTGDLPPLRRVGQFVLLERLGSGGMGVVFAAFDEHLERKVAIKLVATQTGDERAQ